MRGPSALFSGAAEAMARCDRAVSTARRGHNQRGRARALGWGVAIYGGQSCHPADVRACRLGRPGDLVVDPVQGLYPADLCDLPAALDGVVRRTWPDPLQVGRAD